MAVEIERKFRTNGVDFLANQEGERLIQGYLSHDPRATVRLRVQGDRAWLTIKGKTHGASRSEFEYPIPSADAHAMLEEMCPEGVIDKTRYRIRVGERLGSGSIPRRQPGPGGRRSGAGQRGSAVRATALARRRGDRQP